MVKILFFTSQQHCLCVQTTGVPLDPWRIMSVYYVSCCCVGGDCLVISQYFVDLQGT